MPTRANGVRYRIKKKTRKDESPLKRMVSNDILVALFDDYDEATTWLQPAAQRLGWLANVEIALARLDS